MLDKQSYKEAMANLGAAVNVITGHAAEGRVGCTVSAVCSVTDEPPTLLVCINRSSQNNAAFKAAGALCVNVLSADQRGIAERFATKNISADERFGLAQWDVLATGAPALRDALASLDCEIVSAMEVGTHTVFSCTVKAVRTAERGDGLVYFGRGYHRLNQATSALR
ncbi:MULTISPECIES: flavin reductase [unclassified Variovorax]|jgi:flavin reductase|uniref:flavin reductase n=1 Tax=unclassified Variovorax TaxID=663243 RepID=UPI0016040F67|nr:MULTISPECIES: flavin reductase [unclassified Variovorax]MBB1601534.1 flavin reductase [Variovorax sp. UMC13]MDM0086462.1 flavin reductase [Variovorax sp. J22G40]MDM0145281.1 flavin reductase [Variovorax sp. J2P1-31]